jgi:hypothetical protein
MKKILLVSSVVIVISLVFIGYSSIRNHDYGILRDHQPTPPTRKTDIKVDLSSIPELNEVVTVTMTFTPLEDLPPHEPTDEATIVLHPPFNGLKFVGGDSVWVGELKKGETHTLKAQIKPVKAGIYRVGGGVGYFRQPQRMLPENAPEYAKRQKSFGALAWGSNVRFEVKAEADTSEELQRILNDSIGTKTPVSKLTLIPLNGPDVSTLYISEAKPGEHIPEYGYALDDTVSDQDTLEANKSLTLYEAQSAVFYLYKGDGERVPIERWWLLGPHMGTIEPLSDEKALFTAHQIKGFCRIVGEIDGKKYTIPITIRELPQKN